MPKYKITKTVEAESLAQALEVEPEASVDSIEKMVGKDGIGFKIANCVSTKKIPPVKNRKIKRHP